MSSWHPGHSTLSLTDDLIECHWCDQERAILLLASLYGGKKFKEVIENTCLANSKKSQQLQPVCV
jgi:uncharacterized protein CbrC (UPF0167 family)